MMLTSKQTPDLESSIFEDSLLKEEISGPGVLNTIVNFKFHCISRNFRLVCSSDCILLKMSNRAFKRIYEHEINRLKEVKMSELYKLPILQGMPEQLMKDMVINRFEEKTVPYRHKIYDFGDSIDSIYFVQYGDFALEIDYTLLDPEIEGTMDGRRKDRINKFIQTGRQALIDAEEKTVCYKKISDYFGDFEYLCGYEKRYSRAVCMSNSAKIFELKIKHVNYWLKENLESMVQSRVNHDIRKAVNEKS
jgi:hypothetical protein